VAKAERIERGSRVRMHYTLRLEDGTVADSTEGEQPIEFVMGDGTLIEGLERVLLGLAVGEEQSFEIDPFHGYGFADPNAVHVLARGDFPPDMDLSPGTIVGFDTPGGDELAGTVKRIEGEQVTVDFSHPLAGHTLSFNVRIVAVLPKGAPTAPEG
jgi:FKBP-type peptidyl-prolyl cis-trans isomerase SlpA